MADSINIVVPKAATDSIIKTGNEIIKLDGAYMKLLKNIESGQAMLKSQGTSFEKLNKHKNNAKKITKDLTTLEKERIKIQNQTKTATAQITIATEKETKALAKKKLALQEGRRETKLNIVANKALTGSYNKISALLSKNIIKWKKLSQKERENTKAGQQLTTTIKKQEMALQKLNTRLGQSQRKVGSYKASIMSAGKSLMMVAGVGGGLFMLVRGLGSVIKKYTAFEHIMSKVKAVADPTNIEFVKLRNQAQRLGESTEKTASQVGQLQVNLSKLGFTAKDILLATGAILDLSTAADADLGQAATTAAATLKGFGLQSKEMIRVTDVMALSFSSSALDLDKFTNSMNKIAPIAKNANISLETSTAYLSLLVDRGLEASTAGTSLRKMFLELSKQGLTWNDAMEMINNATDKNKRALELFGIRAATAAVILAANSEEAALLTKKYEGAAGSAKKMADVMRDNLKGDADKAKSALEGLSINLGTKLSPTLRLVTQGFTGFISKINEYLKVPLSDNIINEQFELNKLFGELINTKEGTDKRTEAIEKLQKKYPDYIANIDLNTASEEELRKELRLTNIEYQNRYIIQAATEDVDKANEKLARRTLELTKREIKATKAFMEIAREKEMLDKIAGKTLGEQAKILGEIPIAYSNWVSFTHKVNAAQSQLNKVTKESNELIELATKNLKGNTEAEKKAVDLKSILYYLLLKTRDTSLFILAEEKKLQEELFELRKKWGLVTKEELYDKELEAMEKNKEFAILKEKEKQLIIYQLRKKYNLLPIDIEYFESLSRLNENAKKETEKFLMDEEEMYDDEAVYLVNKWKESLEGKYALNEAYYKAEIRSKAEYNDTLIKLDEERNAKELELEEAIREKKWELALATSEALFSIFSSRLDAQMQKNELARTNELEAAGDDSELKDRINQEYDKKQNALRTKQAKAEKKQAIFSAMMNTALAITASLAQFPLPLGLPMLLLNIAMGAVQLATIIARPIPKFKHGTKGKHGTPDTFITSEKGAGTEWTQIAGKIIQTSKPTLHINSEGARVYSNKEIQRLIANDQIGFDSRELIESNREGFAMVTKAIKKQKQLIIESKITGYSQDGYTRKYIERMTE